MRKQFNFCLFIFLSALISLADTGCANIGQPTGGPRDSAAPILEKAIPASGSVNNNSTRFTLNFDEYVEVKDPQTNVIVSPLQLQSPVVRSNFKTISVRLRDSLLPNTTYIVNFGDAIQDLNEGNVLKNFSYIFSTGAYIDSLTLSGKVIMAQTGHTDSTLQIYLYQNSTDSAILLLRPKYITRLNGLGEFKFTNLPAGNFRVYALKDGDGGKTYNSKTETFAFLPGNAPLQLSDSLAPVTLYAYAEETSGAANGYNPAITQKDNKKSVLRITTSADQKQDILNPLEIYFTNPVLPLPTNSLMVTDTNYRAITNVIPVLDSLHKTASIKVNWIPGETYYLLINNTNLKDSLGNNLFKSDTLKFTTKTEEDYGKILLRFTNIDLKKHPVLQIMQGEIIKFNYQLNSNTWQNNRFPPGEYEIRILFDDNNNGKWDPGDFKTYRQPEKAISFPQKLSIRANWDNERDINL